MKIEKRVEKIGRKKFVSWWIVDVPSDVAECGPYDTRSEALKDRFGMLQSFAWLNKRTAGAA